jgi:hypothetical protein
MGEEPSNAALLIHLQYIRQSQDQTNAHLAMLNGRMGEAEQELAVLKDRSGDAKAAGAKWGGLVGGVIAGAVFVWQLFKGAP